MNCTPYYVFSAPMSCYKSVFHRLIKISDTQTTQQPDGLANKKAYPMG
ncbi:hypothetical protein ASZ84_02937 [Vibrio cholerae]|uniref:Uncharacterized protein n=1 Tax=Vibrio cholerae serotype O1 (strain ATCC 39541 / Classical Ogawa 395 / O395) TaxID=345073 RepID=A0A0H3AFE7_VIBC3|nr:hypothetical protein VC0395_1097 [Vibrio cholerae O395]APF61862.1 hypothetical protein ASZ84_02937 [Vibrio cholerae]EAZ75222.1 hypothetical protein A5C_A0224 [Vibrio cholerae NCTC 8457]EMP99150.1 hypothetical protein VC95412_001865 [Vibrio cholerae O1 str. 95412]APF77590.1 hypothetical protein ASZ83_03802 [Vibrio cholerae]